MNFNKALFWDVHMDSLDMEQHARFIIERVVTRGNMTDWKLLKKVYGTEKIKLEVLYCRFLDQKTVSFLSTYFAIKKTDFRCCS